MDDPTTTTTTIIDPAALIDRLRGMTPEQVLDVHAWMLRQVQEHRLAAHRLLYRKDDQPRAHVPQPHCDEAARHAAAAAGIETRLTAIRPLVAVAEEHVAAAHTLGYSRKTVDRYLTELAHRLERASKEITRLAVEVQTTIDEPARREHVTILDRANEALGIATSPLTNSRFDLIVKYAAAVDQALNRLEKE